MSCNFNILWIDDEIDWCNSIKRDIEYFISEHCLKLNTQIITNSEFNEIMLNDKLYDLILVDYKYNDTNETGEKIIDRIRKHDVITDILFYSVDRENMIKKLMERADPLEGIYFANRRNDDFISKLNKIIDKIIKRSEDTTNLRGIVLDNTCDFENRTIEFLLKCWELCNVEQKKQLDTMIKQQIEDNKDNACNACNKLTDKDNAYIEGIGDNYIFSHMDRLKMLAIIFESILTEHNIFKKDQYKNISTMYNKNIQRYRNALSHMTEEKYIIINTKKIPIDQNLHRQLRNALNDFDGHFRELEEYIDQLQTKMA